MMSKFKIQNSPAKAGSRKMREKFKINLKFQIQNKKFLYFVICALVSMVYLNNSYAQSISSTELINNAKAYDGKAVVYEGEVIGDIMARGKYVWMNVHDGQTAIGIWLSKDLTKNIRYTGSYKFKGDGVRIKGVFHRACPEHGGDLDIHAQTLSKINPGRPTPERLNPGKKNFVLVLLGILCIVLILRQLKRA